MDVWTDAVVGLAVTLGVGAIIGAVVVYYRTAVAGERLNYIRSLVEAAEQLAGSKGLETGEQRLNWVLYRIQRRYPGLDATLAATLVESIVYRLNKDKAP